MEEIKQKVEDLEMALNYVCYDATLIPKLQTVWAKLELLQEAVNKNCNAPAVSNWVAVTDKLPPLHKHGMSKDVLTIAGSKMSVKSYDYELERWNNTLHVTVKYWMELPEPPCC